MNKLKNFVFFVFIFASFVFVSLFFLVPKALAVTKISGDLELTCEEPLFSSAITWYPSLKENAPFQVKNNGEQIQKLMLKAESINDPNNLSEVFYIKITKGTEILYGNAAKTLVDFFGEDEVFLSEIDKGTLTEYGIEIEMDKEAGNKWQDKSLSFDFKFWFSGKEEEAVTVAGVSAPGPADPATAPVCTDVKPETPTGFAASAGPGVGEVSLSWTPPDPPYTYFLIAYSDNSDSPKWGNPDVGNVTSFTVSGLGGGTYWFWLRAGNGCMPGDFVGPVSPGAIGGAPGAGPVAPGFEEGVLGEETPDELGEAEAIEPGEVAGIEKEPLCFWWWALALFEAGLVGIYCWWVGENKKQLSWYVILATAVLAYIGDHFIAHRFYTPSRFCHWMWLWVILAAGAPVVLCRLYFKQK